MENKIKRQVLNDNIKKILTFIEDNSIVGFSTKLFLEKYYKTRDLKNTLITINGQDAILRVDFSFDDYFLMDKDGVVMRRGDSDLDDVTEDWMDNFANRKTFQVLEEAIEAFCIQWKGIKETFLEEVKEYASIFDFQV